MVGVEVEEQFFTEEQQRHVATLGMWIFLASELLLFSSLFLSALTLRILHPDGVTAAALHLKFWIGATNTAVLILSSFTMSVAIEASKMGWQKPMVLFMRITATLGMIFLALKGYEYYRDYAEHMTPFLSWRDYDLRGNPSSQLFVNLYYIITALHGAHLSIGIGIVLVMASQASAPGYLKRRQNRIEITGLYWHFIDVIWIIVFPTLYLVNR